MCNLKNISIRVVGSIVFYQLPKSTQNYSYLLNCNIGYYLKLKNKINEQSRNWLKN